MMGVCTSVVKERREEEQSQTAMSSVKHADCHPNHEYGKVSTGRK